MDYGMFWLLSAYATVGFIWFMRGINGYENVWEYQEGETKILDRFHKVVDGVEYFWKPKRFPGGGMSIQEGKWVTYYEIDAGLEGSKGFYVELRDKIMDYKWSVTHDAHSTRWKKEYKPISLGEMSYKDALALTDEEFEMVYEKYMKRVR